LNLAQINDDLSGSGVECVEVSPVLSVQALEGEVVDATKPLHKFPEKKGLTSLD